MTKFTALLKVMSRDRFRLINWLLVADIAVVAVTLLWSFATRGIQPGETFGVALAWSMVAFAIAFVLLSVRIERVYTRDTYRLLPLGDTKLYLTNLLSSLVMFIYFGITQLIIYLIAEAVDNTYLTEMLRTISGPNYSTAEATKVCVGLMIMGLSLIILGWTTISLVHLAISATNNFLPSASRWLINVILYVIVIYLVVRVIGFLLYEFNNFGQLVDGGGTTHFLINILGVLIVAGIEVVLNIFILKKWVETIPN
ncbi:ABC transporter permease [Levilactobacillus sp. N40-8-2]|uniref:ABC transporter permease n=1 Tax=Levilactobacillus muriae TaxID=3238987 RepID=UPI0038B296E5